MGTGWREAERKLLRELWPTNKAEVIALRMRRSKGSIIGQAHRLGLENKAPLRGKVRFTPRQVDSSPPIQPVNRLSGPVPLLQAKEYHCRAIVEDAGPDGLAVFCGEPIVEGQSFSFCSTHLKQYTTRGYR